MSIDKETQLEFLLDETEKFCQDKDLYNSIRKSILILDGQDKELDKGEIPKLLSDSLGISFDSSVGHDFLEDTDDRYEHYHRKEERIPFDIDIFNKITKGTVGNNGWWYIAIEMSLGSKSFNVWKECSVYYNGDGC